MAEEERGHWWRRVEGGGEEGGPHVPKEEASVAEDEAHD